MWVIKTCTCAQTTFLISQPRLDLYGESNSEKSHEKFVQALLREKMSRLLQSCLGEGRLTKTEKDMAITYLTHRRKRKKGMGWKETERHSETQPWVQNTKRQEKELPLPVKWLCYSNQNTTRQREHISFTILKSNQVQGFPTFLTSPTQHTVSQASHLSQISFCSSVKGFTALTCSLESSLLAYSTRRKIHSFPSAVTPWTCFSLKAAAFAVSPKTGRVFNVWSNLQRKSATVLVSEEPNGLLLLTKITPTSKALSSQSSGHSLQPKLAVLNFQPTHVVKIVV